jgi:hypothetical protein
MNLRHRETRLNQSRVVCRSFLYCPRRGRGPLPTNPVVLEGRFPRAGAVKQNRVPFGSPLVAQLPAPILLLAAVLWSLWPLLLLLLLPSLALLSRALVS